MDVRIIGVGTAVPPLRVTQEEVYEAYLRMLSLSPQAMDLLEQVLLRNDSIAYRHMAMTSLDECVLENSQDQLIARYKRYAVPLGVEAARKALERANLSPDQIDAIVVNTCTGYLCPGLSSYVAEELGLRRDVHPFDFQGMGCGGALPGLETAYYYLLAHAGQNVLTLAVEMCTATIFFNEEPGVLISNCIFGDGAAATVLTSRPGSDGLRAVAFTSGLYPEYRSYLYYTTEDSKLKNVLSPRVPNVGAKCGKQVVDRLLESHRLGYDDVFHWVVHPGGQKVIDAFQRAFKLSDEAMASSRAVLLNYGNLSSASVLFVLEETLQNRAVRSGERLLMCSFGAGFTVFAGLLECLG